MFINCGRVGGLIETFHVIGCNNSVTATSRGSCQVIIIHCSLSQSDCVNYYREHDILLSSEKFGSLQRSREFAVFAFFEQHNYNNVSSTI